MSKKYRYIRLENISNFEGWDLVETIPAKSNEYYDMCVMCLDDAPSQRDEEIEMLKSYKSLYEDLKAEYLETIKAINKCKAEAIKEFAKKIIENSSSCVAVKNGCEMYETKTYSIHATTIDCLVKEIILTNPYF